MTSSSSTTPRGVLGQSTILGRLAQTSFSQNAGLSATQSQVDGLLTHFVDEAANPTTLAALMAGGMAYRFGRIGTMALGEGRLAAAPLRFLSMATGLGTEVGAFELTSRTLSGDSNPNRWNWSGQGGWAQGLTTSAITFGMLKSAGFLAREQNIVLQHAFQSSAMVAGHNTAGLLGIAARPEGSLAEQFLHAEVTNIQLGAGTGLLHTMAPGLNAFERSLDLSIRARETGAPLAAPLPQLAMATVGTTVESPSPSREKNPNTMMMSSEGGENPPNGNGGNGSEPPPPSGVRPSVPPDPDSNSRVEVSFADISETEFDEPESTKIGRSPLAARMAQEPPPPEGTASSLEQAVHQAIERHSSDKIARPEDVPEITVGDGTTPALVVTGGSSGIGMSLVLEAAQRGYLIVYGGTRPFAELAPELQALKSALYVPVHVEDPDSVNVFRDQALFLLKGTTGPLHVLASAGISARDSQAEIDRMMGVNVGGTRNLLQSFAETLKRSSQNRFVGFGSIVAAENVTIPGDEAYQESKKKIHDLVLLMPDYQTTRGIEGFTVMPGAVDTPMLRKEAAPSFIFLNLMRELTRADSPVRPALESQLGIKLEGKPADLVRTILGDRLTQSPKVDKIETLLLKDPKLTPNKRQGLLAVLMSQDPNLQAAIMNILNSLDIAVPPSFVAEKTLYQLESGRIPENQMLKVYSRSGQDWILRAFGNTEDSALPLPPPPPTRPTPRTERTTRIDRPRRESHPPVSFAGVVQEGNQFRTHFRVPSLTAHAYSASTGNVAMSEKGLLPSAMTFVGAFPAIMEAVKDSVDRGVVHGREEITYLKSIRSGDEISVELKQKTTGKPGQTQIVTLTRELKNGRDEIVATGTTKLLIGGDSSKAKPPTVLSPEQLTLLPAPQIVLPIHPEMIDYYAAASGDMNPVHLSDKEAQARGLPGRILHGMATYNFAERALFEAGVISAEQPLQLKANFEQIVRPGDELRIFVQASEKGGHTSTVINQRNERVMTLEARKLEAPASSENPPPPPATPVSPENPSSTSTSAGTRTAPELFSGPVLFDFLVGGTHPIVAIDAQAGGFPKITHGGLVGEIGAQAIANHLSLENLPGASRLTFKLRSSLEPGRQFELRPEGNSEKASVEFREPGGDKPLASVAWEPLKDSQPIARPDVSNFETNKSGEFICLESCVAFGKENPKGLHLTARYQIANDGRASRIWTGLNLETGNRRREQMLAIDELGWWMGAAVTGKTGVTTSLDYRSWRNSLPGEKLFVVAERPERVSMKMTKIPVVVTNETGEVIARADVGFIPREEAAEAGMQQLGDTRLAAVIARLKGMETPSSGAPSGPSLSGIPPASGEPLPETPAPDAVRGSVLAGVESGVQPAGTHHTTSENTPSLSQEPVSPVATETDRPSAAVEVSQKVTRQYGKATVEVDVSAGRAAVQRALDRLSPTDLGRLVQLASERPSQPWFIAGVSDGMGFHSSVALIASGMLRSGVGVFYEPDALLRMKSAVHLGRLANVEGLRVFAEERGAAFPIVYEDMVLPRWGHPEGNRTLPEGVRTAIETARTQSQNPDLHFINSIAFARWISPEPGIERRIGVPSLDLEGRIILMDMKEYKEDNYNGTLDSMGRNHGVLLNELAPYFGPKSTSYFFTWAGGSQNWDILRGVYGGGSLGHAKEIGESDAVRFHLSSLDLTRDFGQVLQMPAQNKQEIVSAFEKNWAWRHIFPLLREGTKAIENTEGLTQRLLTLAEKESETNSTLRQALLGLRERRTLLEGLSERAEKARKGDETFNQALLRTMGDVVRGSHRIVRYPDFLSFALFGIPGGGAFGLIARHVLETHGYYRGISELAPRTYIKSFDGTHNHRNPVAQIEFDQPESTFMDEIRTNLNEFYRRVAAYREQHPEWDPKKPLPIEASRELLRGLVSDDYVSQIPQATE